MACALAQKACRDGFAVLYKRTSELFRELSAAHADGRIGRFLLRLARIDVLLLDDFAMAPLKDAERRDFRLIHNAHRIELKGESLRKKRRKPGEEDAQ